MSFTDFLFVAVSVKDTHEFYILLDMLPLLDPLHFFNLYTLWWCILCIPISIFFLPIVYCYCCLRLCIWPLISLCKAILHCSHCSDSIHFFLVVVCCCVATRSHFNRSFFCFAWQFGFVYLFVVYVVVIWFILDLLVVILKQLKHLCIWRIRIISASGVFFFSFSFFFGIMRCNVTHQVLARLIHLRTKGSYMEEENWILRGGQPKKKRIKIDQTVSESEKEHISFIRLHTSKKSWWWKKK